MIFIFSIMLIHIPFQVRSRRRLSYILNLSTTLGKIIKRYIDKTPKIIFYVKPPLRLLKLVSQYFFNQTVHSDLTNRDCATVHKRGNT